MNAIKKTIEFRKMAERVKKAKAQQKKGQTLPLEIWLVEEDLAILQESFLHMAEGGDGGFNPAINFHPVREEHYPGLPDSFFQKVCEYMNWKEKQSRFY